MRIFAMTPIHVGKGELARRQARYDELSPPGLTVRLCDIGADAPRALETDQDVRDSEGYVTAALRAAPEGYDAYLPDCVLDPGVADLAGQLPAPVVGLLRLSVGWNVLVGRASRAAARNDVIAAEIEARVKVYGWSDAFHGVAVLGLPVESIPDPLAWTAALEQALRRLAPDEATDVINGCSAVDLPEGRTHSTVRVVDPTQRALRLLAAGELP